MDKIKTPQPYHGLNPSAAPYYSNPPAPCQAGFKGVFSKKMGVIQADT
jgi:hypothetical protein